ncbi:hypothetical protein [uncultured Subdoligranulum sp.]|uniref:hypothetical protein n=1 Tax=uncultured Subdoligranulum sp. TaxID=512298 RepID=UPI0026397CF6|nr:hypothetical protein [uncultured Subdoligranulum sp.]
MKYIYAVEPGTNMKISTPGVTDFQSIKKEVQMFPNRVENHSVYPNGFEITMIQYADSIAVGTNMPLEPDGNGGFIAPTDK